MLNRVIQRAVSALQFDAAKPPRGSRLAHCCSRAELRPVGTGFWHCVQIYESVAFLASTVASYTADGLAAGEAVIIVSKEANRSSFEDALRALDVNVEEVLTSGQLTLLSAEQTLAQFTVGGCPDKELFNYVVGGVIDQVSRGPWRGLRAFGEMVAIFWEAGQASMALRLEHFWDELAETRKFSLLCAYALQCFEWAEEGPGFSGVCEAHSNVLPSESFLSLTSEADRLRAIARLQQLATAALSREKSLACPDPQTHNTLTRLPALPLLESTLRKAFFRSDGASLIAVIAIGLDFESRDNEAVLEIARRFGTCVSVDGSKRSLFQTSPDQFIVLAEGLHALKDAHLVVRTLASCLESRAVLNGKPANLPASFGVAVSAPEATTSGELLADAMLAQKSAQQRGSGQIEFYNARLKETNPQRTH